MELIIENLACKRGGRHVFEGLSFSVQSGQGVLIKGPNGAGKTSLLKTLAGFIPASAGNIILKDGDPELEIYQQSHYVGHLNGIKHGFSVYDNVAFYASYFGHSNSENVIQALNDFHLAELQNIPSEILSAGQKRRLGLTRLIVAFRPIWILDEPTVSLDHNSQEILAQLVAKHVTKGGIVIASTHIPLGIDFTHTITLLPRGVS